MKISKLIAELKEAQAAAGDLEIAIDLIGYGLATTVESVETWCIASEKKIYLDIKS